MNSIKSIAGINLIILVVYTILVRLANPGSGGMLSVLIISAVIISMHVLVLLGYAIFNYRDKEKQLGKAYLLTSGLILLVGFSTCWGIPTF